MTPAIRAATHDDVDALAATLAVAFFDDPVFAWVVPDDDRRVEVMRGFFQGALADMFLPLGATYTDGERLVGAVWAPPGKWQVDDEQVEAMGPALAELFGDAIERLMTVFAFTDEHHPLEPHWYLAVLGTEPSWQGRGLGTAAMQPILEHCDTEGLPAYLESSKERNVPFYERHGFRVTEELRVPDGPTLWGMWRNPC